MSSTGKVRSWSRTDDHGWRYLVVGSVSCEWVNMNGVRLSFRTLIQKLCQPSTSRVRMGFMEIRPGECVSVWMSKALRASIHGDSASFLLHPRPSVTTTALQSLSHHGARHKSATPTPRAPY